jgi:riboflavin synthase
MRIKIGVADTMFARMDMGGIAEAVLRQKPECGQAFELVRRTVPGMKDLPVAARNMILRDGCLIVLAYAMPGRAALDRQCALEAGMGLMLAQVLTGAPILEAFVHEDEAEDEAALAAICQDRCAKHALNAYDMMFDPQSLVARAGCGVRQGGPDAGPLAAALATA